MVVLLYGKGKGKDLGGYIDHYSCSDMVEVEDLEEEIEDSPIIHDEDGDHPPPPLPPKGPPRYNNPSFKFDNFNSNFSVSPSRDDAHPIRQRPPRPLPLPLPQRCRRHYRPRTYGDSFSNTCLALFYCCAVTVLLASLLLTPVGAQPMEEEQQQQQLRRRAYTAGGRWGHSTVTLSSHLLVYGGKAAVPGQTYTSTPNTNDLLSLDLSASISDLSNPPWQLLSTGPNSGPSVSYSTLSPVGDGLAMLFGGDSGTTTPLPSANDSVWFIQFPMTKSSNGQPIIEFGSISKTQWTHEPNNWKNQPQRRIRHSSVSAQTGSNIVQWIFGGLTDDQSGKAYSEFWVYEGEMDSIAKGGGSWNLVQSASGSAGDLPPSPPATYDHTATVVPSADATSISIVLLGGALPPPASSGQSPTTPPTLANFSSIWVFTPTVGDSTTTTGGSWTLVPTTGTPLAGRRAHAATHIGDGKIWVFGGANADGTQVLNDGAVLDTRANPMSWTVFEGGSCAARWGHSAVEVGGQVVVTFGYGTNAAVDTSLCVYDPSSNGWASSFSPSASSPGPAGPSSGGVGGSSDGTGTGTGGTASGGSPTSLSQPTATPTDSGATSWTTPGQSVSATSGSSTPTAGLGDAHDGGGGNKTGMVVGAVFGVLGGLALIAGGGYYFYKKRNQYSYQEFDRDGGGDGGRPGGGGGGGAAPVWSWRKKESSGDTVASSMRAGPKLEMAFPVGMKSTSTGVGGAGGGLRRAFSGIWPVEQPRRERRFDMLDDEESEEGVNIFGDMARSPTSSNRRGLDPWDPDAGRAGMGVWDGVYDASTNIVSTSKSFLGGALGPWIAGSRRGRRPRDGHALDDLAQDSLHNISTEDPFRDEAPSSSHDNDHWDPREGLPNPTDIAVAHRRESTNSLLTHESPDDDLPNPLYARVHDEDTELSVESHQTHHTGQTVGTLGSTQEIATSSSHSNPLSSSSRPSARSVYTPATSLYGSGFTPVDPSPEGKERDSPSPVRRRGTWFEKFFDRNTRQFEPIRDLAQPMGAIQEGSDPFTDPSRNGNERRETSTRPPEVTKHRSQKSLGPPHRQGASLSSQLSAQTATSSMLEGMEDMVVVERTWTASSGYTDSLRRDSDSTRKDSSDGHGSRHHQVLQEPAPLWHSDITEEPGDGIGDLPRSASPVTSSPMTPTREHPPSSPKAPRPPPLNRPPPAGAGHNRKGTAGSVKDLIRDFEKRSSTVLVTPQSPSSPQPPIGGSSRPNSSGRPTSSGSDRPRRGTMDSGGNKNTKVDHGLAKRPVLYVANPDDGA